MSPSDGVHWEYRNFTKLGPPRLYNVAVCMPRKWDCTKKNFWIPAEILGSGNRFDTYKFPERECQMWLCLIYKIKEHLKFKRTSIIIHMFDLKSGKLFEIKNLLKRERF